MGNIRFSWPCYLPRPAKRVLSMVVVTIVVILAVAVTGGYGEAAVAALGLALMSAVVTEGVKVVLRALPRSA